MMSSKIHLMFSRLLVFSLLLSLFSFRTATAFTVAAGPAAEISVAGQAENGEKPFVLVNGERSFNGRTFFSNGTITTTETSSATINLGKAGRVKLEPASLLTLSFTDGSITGILSKGQVSVSNVDGVSVNIETPNDAIKNDGTSASKFTVAVSGNQTGVKVAKGSVTDSSGKAIKDDDDDDDDDDDHWKAWAWAGVIAGAVVAIVLITTLGDDDDETVSPVR